LKDIVKIGFLFDAGKKNEEKIILHFPSFWQFFQLWHLL
jgi:hypothetical protein